MTHLDVDLAGGGTALGRADTAAPTAGVAGAGAQEVDARTIAPIEARLHSTLMSIFDTQRSPALLSWELMFVQLAG